MKEYMLSFELLKDNDEIEIHATKEGLEFLKIQIEMILKMEQNEHIHLITESWGGKELTEELQNNEGTIINKVTLFKWD